MINPKKADKIATFIISILSAVVVLILGSFILYILYEGIGKLNFQFLFGNPKTTDTGGGIGPQLFNSFYMLIISLIITVPIGIGAGIYLAEYAKEGPVVRVIRLCLETMSSLPSIVIGMFGLLIFVNVLGFGYSIIAGALSVSILNIPSMTRVSENAIKIASKKVKEASLGLGATRWQTIYKVIVPGAKTGILTGIVLGIARAFGEALAVQMVIGNTVKIPDSIFSSMSTLTSVITMDMANTIGGTIWNDALWSLALILLIISFGFILLVRFIGKRCSR